MSDHEAYPQVGEINTSGTWTDGLPIGSPEWIENSVGMHTVGLMIELGAYPADLMGVFDKPVFDPTIATEENFPAHRPRVLPEVDLERVELKMDAGEASEGEKSDYFHTLSLRRELG